MITLYDFPTLSPGRTSPNVRKTRIELRYRGLPYKTIYIEYPDVEPTCIKIGALPTSKRANGSDFYTLPVIHDSSTNKVISDSHRITEYLEETYPDTPRLFPNPVISSQTLSSKAAIRLFEDSWMDNVVGSLMPIIITKRVEDLQPRSIVYWRPAREARFGCSLEELSPLGSQKRTDHWKAVREGLDKVAMVLDNSGGEYFFGDVFSRAELIVSAFLATASLYSQKEEWEVIANANGGRWGRLIEKTKDWQVFTD